VTDQGGGRIRDRDGEQATQVYGAASLGRWRVQALSGSRLKEVPTASWGTAFGDPSYQTQDTRGWVSGAYERPVGAAVIAARGFYDFYRYDGVYPFAESDGIVRADDNARADMVGGELSVRRTLWHRHAIVAGVEHHSNLRQDQAFIYDGSLDIDVPRSSQEYAAFVQDEITLGPRWRAIVGGRIDYWSHRGNATGRPRLGLIYSTDYDTAIKVLYGEAYRVANMYELYYYSNSSANMTILAPESLRTTELVLERFIRRRIRLAVSGYYTTIADLIDQTLSDTGEVTHVNSESARARGVEVDAEGRWPSGVLVRASFSLQDAHDARTGAVMSNAPHQMATLQFSVPTWRRQLRLASDTTYTAWRQTASGGRLPGYTLTNATVRYEPLRGPLTIGASVYNVFDRSHAHPVGLEFVQPSIEQNGRTFAVRASVGF
jgi:outer membrane cobalamin receptor